MNHLGADGYHWRVCVEDKPVPGGSGEKTYSWWDIQDENARLPVKEAPQSQIAKLFAPRKEITHADAATKAAKGAFKSLGKAMNAVAGTEGAVDQGPPVSVVAFKLLDLMKMHDDFSAKHGKHGFSPAPASTQPRARARAPVPARQPQQQQQPARTPARQQQPPPQQRAQPHRAPQPARQPQQQASLLDFGMEAAAPAPNPRTLHHTTSSPAAFDQLHARPPAPPVNETRAEKLKREYAEKQQQAQRVWDDVDQRWVEVDPAAGGVTPGTGSAPPGAANPNIPKKKEVGISLDPANAAGKSHHVQAAVHKRVNDMRQSQQKAIQEIKEREEQKKRDEAAEDVVRKKLEPKIKAWSEEHGKKKQLRALLGTLHTILWPEANWKPIGLGDLLDDSKCKRAFHKASRVVHPDKTHHLDAEKRFLAKRIFDALAQAKAEFDQEERR